MTSTRPSVWTLAHADPSSMSTGPLLIPRKERYVRRYRRVARRAADRQPHRYRRRLCRWQYHHPDEVRRLLVELGVAVHDQKWLLASPTTPELLKRVVYVHFKDLFRCALWPRAPLLCGCRKEFWHHGPLLSEALRRRTRRWSVPHSSQVGDVRMRHCFPPAEAGPRRDARAEAQLATWQRRRGHSSPWRPRTRSRSPQ